MKTPTKVAAWIWLLIGAIGVINLVRYVPSYPDRLQASAAALVFSLAFCVTAIASGIGLLCKDARAWWILTVLTGLVAAACVLAFLLLWAPGQGGLLLQTLVATIWPALPLSPVLYSLLLVLLLLDPPRRWQLRRQERAEAAP